MGRGRRARLRRHLAGSGASGSCCLCCRRPTREPVAEAASRVPKRSVFASGVSVLSDLTVSPILAAVWGEKGPAPFCRVWSSVEPTSGGGVSVCPETPLVRLCWGWNLCFCFFGKHFYFTLSLEDNCQVQNPRSTFSLPARRTPFPVFWLASSPPQMSCSSGPRRATRGHMPGPAARGIKS